jgi:hypothetical protein
MPASRDALRTVIGTMIRRCREDEKDITCRRIVLAPYERDGSGTESES